MRAGVRRVLRSDTVFPLLEGRFRGGMVARRGQEPRPLRGFAGLGVRGAIGFERWRRASYMTTAPATETLREETLPAMGMRRRWSQVFLTRSWRPVPSLPRTRTQSVLKSKAV